MSSLTSRTAWALVPLLLLVQPPVAPAAETAAAPRIIMIHGGTLEERIYLTDWKQNLEFLLDLSLTDGSYATSEDSLTAPRFEMALYWGNDYWDRVARDTAELRRLDPTDGSPARIVLGGLPRVTYPGSNHPRVIGATAMRILRERGFPME
jgi:hypothetical protein